MTYKYSIPKEVSQVTNSLKNKGFEAFLVGGCVRDLILNKKPKDWDVTTNAKPEQIMEIFPETFYENDYGTVGVVNEETEDGTLKIVEVTPFRLEGGYSDKRRPDSVSFEATLEDDLERRDFTINAIALDVEKEYVVDPFKGQEDLGSNLIKAVGNPIDRFNEDGLRILRAVRLSAELGFSIDLETEKAILETSYLLKEMATERIRDEFIRMIESNEPMLGIIMAKKLGILRYIVPELEETVDVEQNKAHSYDVWTHSLKSLQHAADRGWPLKIRLAALLHDISKPESRRRSKDKEKWTFYGHEVTGARRALTIMRRLKFANDITEEVVKLVRWHMFFSDTEKITLSAVRRLIASVGKDSVWDLVKVRMCDRIGTGRPKESPYRLRKYQSMIEEVLRDPVNVGMLEIDGKDIMDAANIEPGPKIGFILHALLDEVLDDPTINKKDILTKKALDMVKMDLKELKKLGERGKNKKEEEETRKIEDIRHKYKVQ
ncbi:MAG: hypothetical protein A2653_02655 [Candidatus Zambryskibacteria bacterium RIFCSPHIGHO2_01_FULL_43_25]|uniref:HD/PDEase domain-containing protein n=1 Tax=Candidatus Zambryskibacteria bacterium RIFCSPLOWO2_01_FULL_45_21 TaxID=1802761 RepID=A0A1G2U5I1_9BACT|nr:MAG: hypothetical protein A2653_02655 [Candidatus Zambryskibacteria bacterium RIFCSPHIGHO2_01_FULL_43_25]OHB01176.1 MAG: hypothetical protein A3E94_03015 [Candidatus Zambryskibacteria bacterium RIFCSPHIGHO2_12_FULL_44_12b]OHB04751.1 MAG: hypothetical protein A3B14_03805 [Candidatus Zambryskibacteria bacterium RIFCSPLOWO2_01_FULL_45_21]